MGIILDRNKMKSWTKEMAEKDKTDFRQDMATYEPRVTGDRKFPG